MEMISTIFNVPVNSAMVFPKNFKERCIIIAQANSESCIYIINGSYKFQSENNFSVSTKIGENNSIDVKSNSTKQLGIWNTNTTVVQTITAFYY